VSQGPAIARIVVQGVVSDSPPVYIDGRTEPVSISSDGRLRVLTVAAPTYLEFFSAQTPFFNVPKLTNVSDGPWALDQCNPWA